MEAAMNKYLVTTGTLAILAAALLVSGRAEAGGSASAPSKYSNSTSQIAPVYLVAGNRHTGGADVRITEYSSSSARTHAAKYR
jgi:hypothetical protein